MEIAKTYRLGDQISLSLKPNEALDTGIYMTVTFRNEGNGTVLVYSTKAGEEGTISKISDKEYHVTVTPAKCMQLGTGRCSIEIALFTGTKDYVNIGNSVILIDIINSTVGRQIMK